MQRLHVLDAVQPPRMRPLLWHALDQLSARRDECIAASNAEAWRDFERRHRAFRGEWARTPELGAIGLELLDAARPEHMRIEGCIWLTEFPSLAAVEALSRIALDAAEPPALRDQAAWTLGYRQLQESDDALVWPADAVAAADRTLLELWQRGEREGLPQLASALRHVAAPEVLDALAADVIGAAPAIEAFATPGLAAAAVPRLADIPSEHAPRIVRLVAEVLGADVVPELLAYAADAPLSAGVEALFAALTLDAARARPTVDAFLATLTFDRVMRERAAFHEAHPGRFPAVAALRVARTTAVIAPAERTAKCREAGGLLVAQAAVEPLAEGYLYALLAHLGFRARDDALVIACAEATASMLADAPFLVAPYLEALARAGRFDRLAQVAIDNAAAAHATWLLAIHGRPFRALAMRRLANRRHVDAAAGGALALFLTGRPDLAELALHQEPPASDNLFGVGMEPFPGPDERHRIEHEPERWPALCAFAGGLPALIGAMRGAPVAADPDAVDLALVVEREKDLRPDLAGASVYLLGAVAPAIREALEAQGARIVDGPFARVDYFIAAADADAAVVGRLRSRGARELPFP